MRRALLATCIALMIVLAGCSGADNSAPPGGSGHQLSNGEVAVADRSAGQQIGVSAGGAQDANAFRNNVEEGYVPQPTDVTYEGLYHDYYFDTAMDEPCEQRFCPSYSRAVTRDPLSNETERFLAVGLNSGITRADFQREQLDLVVVLDVSSSMESRFDQYYYDGDEQPVSENWRKMEAANDAVATLTERLGHGDRFGLVTYNGDARTIHDLQLVEETDMGALRGEIQTLQASGGTNLDAGMREASEMVERSAEPGAENRTTRIVYVTDAQPNRGELSAAVLGDRIRGQAETGVYSTFVGVGVDFNSELTQEIATTRGANYYTIDSPTQFEERMDEGFAYMVTPLAHDLSLSVETDGYEVAAAYGTPGDDEGEELISVASLFPSRTDGNRTEGGVMLLELDRVDGVEDPEVTLRTSYEDPSGESHESTTTVTMEDREAPYFESSGVRKAVVLTEYANLIRDWAAHERAQAAGDDFEPSDGAEYRELSHWEQTSVELSVSPPYDERVDRFTAYFREHRDALGAERMDRDLAVLETLQDAE